MSISSSAIRRFNSVEKVFVYSLIEVTDMREVYPGVNDMNAHTNIFNPWVYHLDEDKATIDNVVPFISKLPKLKYCFLGGLYRGEYEVMKMITQRPDRDNIRCDFTYTSLCSRLIGLSFGSSDHRAEMKRLILLVCRAYSQGELSQSVTIHGLLCPHSINRISGHGYGRYERCIWRGLQTMRPIHICSVCDTVCQSFPCSQLSQLEYDS